MVASLGDLVKVAEDTDRIFVDIRIGLPCGPEERQCDQKAREMLGAPRASSVFHAPVRAELGATNYAQASEINRATTQGNTRGKEISKQTFAIAPKIREVDSLLRDSSKARRLVREVHPEVSTGTHIAGTNIRCIISSGDPRRHTPKALVLHAFRELCLAN